MHNTYQNMIYEDILFISLYIFEYKKGHETQILQDHRTTPASAETHQACYLHILLCGDTHILLGQKLIQN